MKWLIFISLIISCATAFNITIGALFPLNSSLGVLRMKLALIALEHIHQHKLLGDNTLELLIGDSMIIFTSY